MAHSCIPGSSRPVGRGGWTNGSLPFAGVCVAVLLSFAGVAWLVGSRRGQPAPQGTLVHADTAPANSAALRGRGRLVYLTHCASCHGDDGHGDGASAAALNPPPRDFAGSAWKFGASADAIRRAVAEGIHGTGMPAYANALNSAEMEAMIAYVQTLAPVGAGPEGMPAHLATLLTKAGFMPADALRAALPFEVREAGGGKHALADFRGKAVMLAFWGAECPHCLKRFSSLERLANSYRDRGLAVLPICADETDPAEATSVARRHVAQLAVYADPSALVPRRYNVQVMPTTVLIDSQGRVLGRAEGAVDWSSPAIAKLLNELLEPARTDR